MRTNKVISFALLLVLASLPAYGSECYTTSDGYTQCHDAQTGQNLSGWNNSGIVDLHDAQGNAYQGQQGTGSVTNSRTGERTPINVYQEPTPIAAQQPVCDDDGC